MKKQVKIALCVSAAVIALVVLFNLLPSGIRTTATLCASLLIGLGSLWLGGRIYCPTTVLSIPALLPMVPGIYAYKTVFALIMLMQHTAESDAARQYMDAFLLNATVTVSVVFMLAVGSTVPILLFRRRAFSLTRRRKPRKA